MLARSSRRGKDHSSSQRRPYGDQWSFIRGNPVNHAETSRQVKRQRYSSIRGSQRSEQASGRRFHIR